GPLELVITGRSHNHAGTRRLGKLSREHRNAARAQYQHCLSRSHTTDAHDGVPGGHPGAGQRDPFLERHSLRQGYGDVLVTNYVVTATHPTYISPCPAL